MSNAKTFEEFWESDGKYYDPDHEDVPWYDKRSALVEYVWMRALESRDAGPSETHESGYVGLMPSQRRALRGRKFAQMPHKAAPQAQGDEPLPPQRPIVIINDGANRYVLASSAVPYMDRLEAERDAAIAAQRALEQERDEWRKVLESLVKAAKLPSGGGCCMWKSDRDGSHIGRDQAVWDKLDAAIQNAEITLLPIPPTQESAK